MHGTKRLWSRVILDSYEKQKMVAQRQAIIYRQITMVFERQNIRILFEMRMKAH